MKTLLASVCALALTIGSAKADHVISYAFYDEPGTTKVLYVITDLNGGTWYEIDNLYPQYGNAPNPDFDETYAAIVHAMTNGYLVGVGTGQWGVGTGGLPFIAWFQVYSHN